MSLIAEIDIFDEIGGIEDKAIIEEFTMRIWETAYKGHIIRVEGGPFRRQLLVDNEIQDVRSGLSLSARLMGRIGHGEGAGEPVMAAVGGLWSTKCDIAVNGISLAISQSDYRSDRTNDVDS